MSLDSSEKRFLIARHIVEIFAICFGTWWTINTFGIKEMPSLEESIDSQIEIQIEPFGTDHSIVTVTNEIKNIGRSSFDINSTISKSWCYPIDSVLVGNSIDIEKFMAAHLDTNYNFKNTNSKDAGFETEIFERNFLGLEKHYTPEMKGKESFSFITCRCQRNIIISFFAIYPRIKDQKKQKDSKPLITYSWKLLTKPEEISE